MAEIKPIKLQYEDGIEYVLEFNASTVKEAERAGFNIGEIVNKPMTLVPLLFFFSFKMHHPTISMKKTDKILYEDLGGLSEALQERLVELYLAPMEELGGTDQPKNPNMRVVL